MDAETPPRCEICQSPASVIIIKTGFGKPFILCARHEAPDYGGYTPLETLDGKRFWIHTGGEE